MRRSHHHQWLTTSTTRAMLLSHLPRKRIGGGGVKVFNEINEKHTDWEKSEEETILRSKRETAVNGKWSQIQRNKLKTKIGENLTPAVLITRLTCQDNPHPSIFSLMSLSLSVSSEHKVKYKWSDHVGWSPKLFCVISWPLLTAIAFSQCSVN